MVFSIFLDPQIGTDIVYGRVNVPNFVDFVINVSFSQFVYQLNFNSSLTYRFDYIAESIQEESRP